MDKCGYADGSSVINCLIMYELQSTYMYMLCMSESKTLDDEIWSILSPYRVCRLS